ncbi:MAG: PLP-dependent aminotransferase family protein [Marinobacter sp.]|nr:PLP-dependent aminotransferase family protein [Marinobacter sp.]
MAVNKNIDMVSIICDALGTEKGPKYQKIATRLQRQIHIGKLSHGRKLPAHRELAYQLGVTPGTISRAYSELEKIGVVFSRVGDGTYVKGFEQRALEGEGFKNAIQANDSLIDLSRNKHIPLQDDRLLSQTLTQLALEPTVLNEIFDYTPEAGQPRHQQAGAHWIKLSGIEVESNEVICTNGAQHALTVCLPSVLRRGEILATEHLSYPGLISAARLLGIRLFALSMDEEGIVPESLEEACLTHRISALYCTPTMQNPTASTMSAKRRQDIALVCRKYNLIVIEDEAHGVLASRRPPALQAYIPERTLLITSLSKAVSGGLRVGFIHSPEALWCRIAGAVRASCWMATPLSLEIATRWIFDGTASSLKDQQIAEIRRRKSLVSSLLEGFNFQTLENCSHYWIEIPEPWRASEIEKALEDKNILVKSSESFAVGRREVPQFIRACVSSAKDDEQLTKGFRAFSTILRDLPQQDLLPHQHAFCTQVL